MIDFCWWQLPTNPFENSIVRAFGQTQSCHKSYQSTFRRSTSKTIRKMCPNFKCNCSIPFGFFWLRMEMTKLRSMQRNNNRYHFQLQPNKCESCAKQNKNMRISCQTMLKVCVRRQNKICNFSESSEILEKSTFWGPVPNKRPTNTHTNCTFTGLKAKTQRRVNKSNSMERAVISFWLAATTIYQTPPLKTWHGKLSLANKLCNKNSLVAASSLNCYQYLWVCVRSVAICRSATEIYLLWVEEEVFIWVRYIFKRIWQLNCATK